MFNLKGINILKSLAAVSLIAILSACDNSNDEIPPPVFDPSVAPQNVNVVSGDDSTGEVRNTISWTLDPAKPDYVVFVSNTPDAADIDRVVVVPSDSGFNYVVHSGVDVVAGTPLYYKVQAVSNEESSPLSAEVTGTPQESIASNPLNDVAWNGIDTLVAVGDHGTILNSPNGLADAWTDVSGVTQQSLRAVAWGDTQFLAVGAGGTILTTGDGINWNDEGQQSTATLEDVAWLGDGYIAVGNSGTIITSDITGTNWTLQDPGADLDTVSLNGVSSNGTIIVVVGENGNILTSNDDGVTWSTQTVGQNALNDVIWDGTQFGAVGSNDTILTSPDGVIWTSHIPGTSNITFVAASQWDLGFSSLPQNPILGAVGSAGTFVVSPDTTTGLQIPTGTNEQLSGMTWVDDGVNSPYFVIVGNDGTVLTSQLQQ